MAGLGGIGNGQASDAFNLSAALGRPIAEAASIIARAVAPNNSEADHVITALSEAIERAYDQTGDFDQESVTPDFLQAVIECSLVEMLFHDMANRLAGGSLDNVTPAERQLRENQLHDFISETVDAQLAQRVQTEGAPLTDPLVLNKFQQACLQSVIAEWEGLDG
ncbi:MAG: hypothetical protein ABJG88_05025 [Litorimonas sp.]